jgi:glutamate transport system ATP-binding protein
MAEQAADTGSLVQLRGVSKHVGMVQVLNDIDLDLARGEVIAVLGPAGSGKSMLCRAINGLERIDSGRITVEGRPLPRRGRELARMRRDIGVVSPPFGLAPHRTVLENVVFGRFRLWQAATPGSRRRARALLERFELEDRAGRFPWELSNDQQQRVAMARALAAEPKLMLVDEPALGLSPELLRGLAADGMTLLVATGEPGLARRAADRVVFMDGGRIIEQSPTDDFFTTPRTSRAHAFLARMRQS